MKKIVFLLSILILTVSNSYSQTLKFTINGLKDTTVNLVKYVGKGMYYADTAKCVNGVVEFDGSKHLTGVYAVFLPGQKYFDFLHVQEKIDIVAENGANMVKSIVVKKSKTNLEFYNYIHFMMEKQAEGGKLSAERASATPERIEEIDKTLKSINEGVLVSQKELVSKNKGTFLSDLINMSIEITLPDPPKDENGVITDSNFVYKYYIHHFWDNVNLNNDELIRTPTFHKKLVKYLSRQVLLQIPDTLNKYSDLLIEKTIDSSFMFQYIVSHITSTSEKSDMMGMENVFVHMADKYYCGLNSRAYWMTEEGLEKVCERTNKIRPTIIGSYAPRLVLPDSTENNWVDFYKIKAEYKILYFWEASCGHCKKTTPKLQRLYEEKLKARNVEIYAVGKAMAGNFEEWKKFIRVNKLTFINVGLTKSVYEKAQESPEKAAEIIRTHRSSYESLNYTNTYDIFSTPRIFILDKDNKILYKRLSISQLEEILDKLQGHDDDVKLFPKEEEDPEEREQANG